MNDNQTNKKWSELYGMAIVSLADGKKVGTFDDFYFDPDTHSVYALRVLHYGHDVLVVPQEALQSPQ